jgi:hypothetical protein
MKIDGASVQIWFWVYDPESHNFAEDIGAIFRLSGWKVYFQPASYTGNFVFETRVPSLRDDGEIPSKAIQKALSDAIIDFMPTDIPSPEMITGGYGNQLGHPLTRIYIGPRPMPTIE